MQIYLPTIVWLCFFFISFFTFSVWLFFDLQVLTFSLSIMFIMTSEYYDCIITGIPRMSVIHTMFLKP